MQHKQNDTFYLQEAFNKLKLLNEDNFNLTADRGVVDELQSFVADDIDDPYIEDIIDVNADDVYELADSYVGKVVLQCACCGTKIYKDPEEVFVNDDETLANIEEECPTCSKMLGWKVIGKIEPFEEETPEEDVDVEISDDEIGVAVREALCLDDVTVDPDKASDDTQKLEADDKDPINEDKSLNEDIENLSLDTDVTHMEMTSDENGKVTIVTEPRNVEETVDIEASDLDSIVPLSDEDKDEILTNDEEIVNDEVVDNDADDEFALDEFDEESFDELGESFLNRVYENVDSFNTSKVTYKDKKLIVEGLIKFKSGKEKKTSFVFENFKNTKRGKVLITGLNETFSKSKKAFILKGNLNNRHFVSESLIYNFTAKSINESNESESVKVYGRAVIRK